MNRETITYTVICNECGEKWNSEIEWLENDPCMPERVND